MAALRTSLGRHCDPGWPPDTTSSLRTAEESLLNTEPLKPRIVTEPLWSTTRHIAAQASLPADDALVRKLVDDHVATWHIYERATFLGLSQSRAAPTGIGLLSVTNIATSGLVGTRRRATDPPHPRATAPTCLKCAERVSRTTTRRPSLIQTRLLPVRVPHPLLPQTVLTVVTLLTSPWPLGPFIIGSFWDFLGPPHTSLSTRFTSYNTQYAVAEKGYEK